MVGLVRHKEPTPYDKGFRSGFIGRDTSYDLDWSASSRDYLDWYEGWKAGKAKAEQDAVEIDKIPPQWVRNYVNLRRVG